MYVDPVKGRTDAALQMMSRRHKVAKTLRAPDKTLECNNSEK